MTATSLRDLVSRYDADEMRVPEFNLGDRLRKSMELSKVSVADMATAFGVSRDTVSRWINNRTKPSAAVLHLWATGCGVDEEWLKTGTPSVEASKIATVRAMEAMKAAAMEGDGLSLVHPLGLEPRTRCLTVRPDETVKAPLTGNRRRPILRVVRPVAA